MKKLVLVILDGFGINTKTPAENSIIQAHSPVFTGLFSKLTTQLQASERAVGLPDGQMGNSEVGHLTIGSGRVIKQNLVEIEDMLQDGSFAKLPELINAIEHCKKNNSNLHILQIFGPGGVHGMDAHLKGILKLIPSDIDVNLHLFGDGRDLPPRSMLALMEDFQQFLKQYPNVKISSLAGRYYGMDRDNNRERTQKSYDEIMFGQLQTSDTPCEYIAKSYEKGLTDEFLLPVSFTRGDQIEDGDAIFHLNFRSDRARQMMQALMVSANSKLINDYPTWNKEFTFKTLRNVYIVAMTKPYKEYTGMTFIKEMDIKNTLGEVIAKHEMRQLHIAETEKFAHVTKFLNGDKQVVRDGEKDILIPSHKVATYDLDPEMSAQEIYDKFIQHAKEFDFIVINFANGDMVGHTGFIQKCEIAIKKLDTIIGNIITFCGDNAFELLITADHGNCENMGTSDHPNTAHTTNLVPFRYLENKKVLPTKPTGSLVDIAPTILKIMDIEIPKEMTGKSLI